jgi:AraC-like DNA-binding protein
LFSGFLSDAVNSAKGAAMQGRGPVSVPSHERRFYARNRAFGRFGMRIFDPVTMPQPHWHGHIEGNFAIDTTMDYDFDGEGVEVPPNRLVLFWAGIPHRLTGVRQAEGGRLCNLYLPLDAFLMMPHIMGLQVALLGGAMLALPAETCSADQVRRWYADYRTGDFERMEVVKMELNAMFRRAMLGQPDYLRAARTGPMADRQLSSANIRHVIAMVRHTLENLEKPMRNSDITAMTGLHENYALSLFSRIMQVPLKQFVIRMRLLRARALLVESSMAISTVAESAGFSSVSQFYHQFRTAYGMSPNAVRSQYVSMDLR